MPILLTGGSPTIVVRREAFERTSLSRQAIDRTFTLTDEEFRVERELIVIGPVYDDEGLVALICAFEDAGLKHFDDFFEMSGNWPDWLALHVTSSGR